MKKPYTCSILGVNVAVTNMRDTINLIMNNTDELKGKYICLSNVHTTVMSHKNPKYRRIQNEAFLALPDGSPLSYVQRLRGHQNAKQVAGPDLMAELCKASENTELKHYFYGGSPETIEKLKESLKKKYPNMKIVGMESPPFRPLSKEEDEEAVNRINASGADFLWVGLGAPKQEEWMNRHQNKVNAVMFGVGAAFDFHAGTVKRAPKWMREHYLEWLYRLIQDPKRLWKRYIKTNGSFILLLFSKMLLGKEDVSDDKKRLLIYAHYYYPDVASTGQILTDLAEGLSDKFYITVICTVPSYDGKVSRYYRNHKYYFENINNVEVIRVRVPQFRKSFKLSRVINLAQYFISAIAATFRVGKQDYIFAMSQPPVLGGMLGRIGKTIKRAKLIYNIQDFNPEQIMAVGYFKNKLLLNTVMMLDKRNCMKADEVIVVGRDMVDTLKSRFKNSKKKPKYSCINNWIDEKEIYPLPKDDENVQALRDEYGLNGKYVIMYSGNIGLYYDLKNIIKVIAGFKDEDVAFLFAGDGSVLNELKEYVNKNKLNNVVFAPYQEKERLVYSLNLGDVHFVVNSKGIKGVSVPSKLYGVMAAGKPVLGILEKGTEARTIIEESQCGLSVDPGNYEEIKGLIRYFIDTKDDREATYQGRDTIAQSKMGANGRSYLEKHLTKDISIEKYYQHIISSK